MRVVFVLSSCLGDEFMLTAGAHHDWGSNPGSPGCDPSTLPQSYPAIPKTQMLYLPCLVLSLAGWVLEAMGPGVE